MNDELTNTVDYAAVCRDVKTLVADRTDKLIETLAEAIASHLLADLPDCAGSALNCASSSSRM